MSKDGPRKRSMTGREANEMPDGIELDFASLPSDCRRVPCSRSQGFLPFPLILTRQRTPFSFLAAVYHHSSLPPASPSPWHFRGQQLRFPFTAFATRLERETALSREATASSADIVDDGISLPPAGSDNLDANGAAFWPNIVKFSHLDTGGLLAFYWRRRD